MKKIIKTNLAPAPIGPYSQAVVAGGFIFLSGQIALDPKTGALKTSNIEEETKQVINNISAVLAKAGYSWENVVKCSIFLSDMSLFAAVNDIYALQFADNPPARETVAVKELPKSVNVEISVTAYK